MARKSFKAKEPVRIRFRELADGNKSIYLDIYQNGKRVRDFLKLYLVPERTKADRVQNEQTMRAAEAIKSQRVIELANGAAGIETNNGSKVLLIDWIENYPRTQAQQSIACRENDTCLVNILRAFPKGETMRLADVDRDFCLRFISFLLNDYISPKNGRKLAPLSANAYYTRLVCAMNAAVRSKQILHNPSNDLSASEKIKTPEVQRSYLTGEELQRLINTPARNEAIAETKRAFLFACFCGLRISDIERLTWGDIVEENGQKRIEIRMQKTQELLYIPLSKQAQAYLPERARTATDSDKVFAGLLKRVAIMNHVKELAATAGISKNVSFHTSRHTFATLLLTKGADLYTTSKLLGHTDISTTQIYAKIVDEKKKEAVSLLDNIF